MKVYIGPYHHWFQPYSWTKRAFRWWYGYEKQRDNDDEKIDFGKLDALEDWVYKKFSWLHKLENWIDGRYTPAVKVSVSGYDTWNVDRTLTPIVLPLLKQLQRTKHGAPHVDDSDVPEPLRSTSAPPLTEEQKNFGGVDEHWHPRWEWVLSEMIWAFEQLDDPDSDSQFHYDLDPAKPRHAPGISFSESMRRGGFHKDAYMEWQNRKTHGLTLFGKYFEALWD
jgi:hypothetical protein